jgi:uncharacterized repeat protein (TIGR03803 family)
MQRKGRVSPVIVVSLALVFGVGLTMCAQAQTVSNLTTFDGSNGHDPLGTLAQATDGNLYGATFTGGTKDSGTVFQVTPSGQLKTIYSFCSQPKCADGQYSISSPVLGSDGNLVLRWKLCGLHDWFRNRLQDDHWGQDYDPVHVLFHRTVQ